MNDIIKSYYKRNDLNHIEELIMRVTNYAWDELTLLQQNELREKASAELTMMESQNTALVTVNDELHEHLARITAERARYRHDLARAIAWIDEQVSFSEADKFAGTTLFETWQEVQAALK